DFANIEKNAVHMPDMEAAEKAVAYIEKLKEEGDSAGGIVECVISGVPAGLGEPVFDKLDARLAAAVMSIGAVKGFEIGDGFGAAFARGSVNNDSFAVDGEGNVIKRTNHAGGVLGGISDGDRIVFRAAVKPTPSISMKQFTVSRDHEDRDISIVGRHDPVVVPRAVVVVETMAATVIADMLLKNMSSRIDRIKKFYDKI
ncbi:MAG: chorismate synthase, partial [Lachnospiraceae bacterium]|nr:chorismate synthase [Lachnospiraceae bacterium]